MEKKTHEPETNHVHHGVDSARPSLEEYSLFAQEPETDQEHRDVRPSRPPLDEVSGRVGGGIGLTALSTSAEERRMKRLKNSRQLASKANSGGSSSQGKKTQSDDDEKVLRYLMANEDQLLDFVSQVNTLYQERLGKSAPFMTFILLGMQSAGKSTIVERFLKRCINVVREGTGTRCPLDITCIHDASAEQPMCELSGCKGKDQNTSGQKKNLSVEVVFEQVNGHNQALADQKKFSSDSIYLIVRSRHVQNMRFVDLPGIISNKSNGVDNRDDIKAILKSEIFKASTKMCVLLEPKEFATNPIVDFIDETLGSRDAWIDKATFMMTKFDMRLGDSRTGSKTNAFFKEFMENKVFPHMVITQTLPTENLAPLELFKQRQELLGKAEIEEQRQFDEWLAGHRQYLKTHPSDEELDPRLKNCIGFKSAADELRRIMLEDTAKRLPEVLQEIRRELAEREKEKNVLEERQKYSDPSQLRVIVLHMLLKIQERIYQYLDGDLEIALKFPDRLQTLENEISEEEDSDWCLRHLNHLTDSEERWREQIANMQVPEHVQPDALFLGGKQYHRALEFFHVTMIDTLPEPHGLKKYLANSTGFLGGGLLRENWERAMVQVTKVCVKEVTQPGINYFVKHVGSIFRRLFRLALDDVRQGEEQSFTFKLLPSTVEQYLVTQFDDMLWALMDTVTEKTQFALEPFYSSVDPNLPTFYPSKNRFDQIEKNRYVFQSGKYVSEENAVEDEEETLLGSMKRRMKMLLTGSGEEAKRYLRQETSTKAGERKEFLSDRRASMILDQESNQILQRAFEYITALMEFNLVNLRFQFNHYLYEGFKTQIKEKLGDKLMMEAKWDQLIEPDYETKAHIQELTQQIAGLRSSVARIQDMQRKLR